MKTVVTMTSWLGRINFVGEMIYMFFRTQTKLPDIFYLWLSEDEFPNKEKDLPDDLLLVMEYFGVVLKWLPNNDRNFKRWYVYPEHYFDLVISIDDDQIFDKNLVTEAEKHKDEKNIVYNIFKDLTFEYRFEKGKIYEYHKNENESLKYVWLGCSVVCPQTFPLDAINQENSEIRRKICKRCDESWLKPFSLMNDTKISYFNFNHESVPKLQNNATWKTMVKKHNNFSAREYQLFVCLSYFPNNFEKFKKEFPTFQKYYKNMFEMTLDEILEILN